MDSFILFDLDLAKYLLMVVYSPSVCFIVLQLSDHVFVYEPRNTLMDNVLLFLRIEVQLPVFLYSSFYYGVQKWFCLYHSCIRKAFL